MKKIDYVEIGKRIRFARTQHKLTQEKLAEKVDVAPSYISEIERGTSICSVAVLVNIADVLELNIDNLLLGINSTNADSTFSEIIKNIPNENQDLFIKLCRSIAKTLDEK
jgi:transcriptional regulator with XRE-family HTH domain